MAKGRLMLAILMAVMLVMLPAATGWSVDPNSKDLSRGGLRTDGAGDSGHPWDDGTTVPPPDSVRGRLTSVALPPILGPSAAIGGSKWVTGGLFFLLEKARLTLNKVKAGRLIRK